MKEIVSAFINCKKNFYLISFMLFFTNTCVFSQNDTIKLGAVEIISSRVPVLYSESSRVLKVISKEDIKEFPSDNISDLLEGFVGIDSRSRGPMNVQTDLAVRGGTFEQTQILLNGVKMNDPQTGHHTMNLPVSIDDIERIEILYGPGSRIYGSNAFSGAINIITKNSDENSARVSFSGGDFETYQGNAATTINTGKFSNFISASKDHSGGYIEDTDFNILNLFYQGTLKSKSGIARLSAGYQDKAFGANSFYTVAFPNQFEQVKTTFANLSFKSDGKVKFQPNIFWRRHQDRFELFRDNAPAWYAGHNYHLTDVLGGDLNISFISKYGRTAVGTEIRNEHIYSNKLGNVMDEVIAVPGESEGVFTRSFYRNYLSFYFEHTIYYKRFTFSAGSMEMWNSQYGWGFYPGLDANYQINKNIKYFVSVNRTLRVPTFTELFYADPANKGNINLTPENDLTYETGFKYFKNGINAHVSAYRRDGSNIIDWVKMPDSLVYECQNISDVTIYGLETSVEVNFRNLTGKEIFIKKCNLSYSYNTETKNAGAYISKYALEFLKHKFNVQLVHKIYKDLYGSWNFVWQDREGAYIDAKTKQLNNYEPFFVLNGKVFWQHKKYEVFVEGTNILNKSYFDYGNVIMPGRWIIGGVKLNFGLGIKK